MHQLLDLPKMGLAPISPMIDALLWATTAKEGEYVAVVVVAVVVAEAAAIDAATAILYIDVAAFVAAPTNIIQYCLYCSDKAIFV